MFNKHQESQNGGAVERLHQRGNNVSMPHFLSGQLESIRPEDTAARKLLGDVKELVDINGGPTTINGEPAVATRYYYPERVGQNDFYVRALRRPDITGRDAHSLVFDTSPDLKIETVDPNLLHFQEDPITGNVQIASGIRMGEQIDEAGAIKYSRTVVDSLKAAVRKDQLALERQAAERKWQRQRRWETTRRTGAIGAACIVGASALTYGVRASQIFESWEARYDQKEYTLPATNTVGLGEHGQPAFSPELLVSDDSGIVNAPDLNDGSESYKINTLDDTSFTVTDGIRKLTLLSSEKGNNCAETILDTLPPAGTRIASWTGAADGDAQSHAHEFDVRFNIDRVQVCWNGQEKDYDDNPTVFVRMIPPVK